MSDSSNDFSFRRHTNAIRHLDASQARQLVGLFDRPVTGDQRGPAYDAGDPILESADGEVSLQLSPGRTSSATVVGHSSTHLYLQSLLRLPLSVARELTRHHGHLYLDKVATVTDAVAEELAQHVGGGLSLNNLRSISVPSAWSLGRHAGELSLNRLHSLHPDAALGLARHACQLCLSGLRRLCPPVAAALSQHRGDLFLDSLQTLPGRVASHLARHRGKLHLHGVAGLSDAVAEAFGGRQRFLCLRDVERLSPAQAQLLAGHRGPLLFHRLTIDDDVAVWLGRHEGSLAMNVENGIALPRLESLMRHVGQISLAGLSTIDERQAGILAAQTNWHGVEGLSGLFLDSVGHLSPSVASILATHRAGGLSLKGIRELNEGTAQELARHPILCLDGVTTISDGVASIFGRYDGATLSLKGLTVISPSALSKLRDNPAVELSRHLYADGCHGGDRTFAGSAGPPPDTLETIRIIEQIVHHGDQIPKT